MYLTPEQVKQYVYVFMNRMKSRTEKITDLRTGSDMREAYRRMDEFTDAEDFFMRTVGRRYSYGSLCIEIYDVDNKGIIIKCNNAKLVPAGFDDDEGVVFVMMEGCADCYFVHGEWEDLLERWYNIANSI